MYSSLQRLIDGKKRHVMDQTYDLMFKPNSNSTDCFDFHQVAIIPPTTISHSQNKDVTHLKARGRTTKALDFIKYCHNAKKTQ